ncbi:Flavin-binding monooxygenase-like protein [Necator americanus]|uniref:Flavin-containing monooxygenase n=1 Tax=Necator americanus TaxID=51031 RepID=W2SJ88_NECAM|nr:Flavin-binding monooxygenase-like protein [Necator americanus]ETN69633.1 Flavin-binding monooxygenase-like protein [Necator americanus]
MVCVGHHVYPYMPTIDGSDLFKGTFSHSHDYKAHDFTKFIDRNVLVVGLGNSGGDIACELARVAKQVTLFWDPRVAKTNVQLAWVVTELRLDTEIDDVIFCTGYNFDFGFIEKGEVVEAVDNHVIGLVDPLGPTTTICEMQTRAVAHMWAKKADCPSEEEMLEEILEVYGRKTFIKFRFKAFDVAPLLLGFDEICQKKSAGKAGYAKDSSAFNSLIKLL